MKYVIIKCSHEFKKNIKDIYEGCTYDMEDSFEQECETFGDKEEALEALKSYSSDVRVMTYVMTTYAVTEYFVETRDDDDMPIGTEACTSLDFVVSSCRSYPEIEEKSFKSGKEALEYADKILDEQDIDTNISFN